MIKLLILFKNYKFFLCHRYVVIFCYAHKHKTHNWSKFSRQLYKLDEKESLFCDNAAQLMS